jgi:hypothetical protein
LAEIIAGTNINSQSPSAVPAISRGLSDKNESLLRIFGAICVDPVPQEGRGGTLVAGAKANSAVKVLQVRVRYRETLYAFQEWPNFPKYFGADSLSLKPGLNPHSTSTRTPYSVAIRSAPNKITPAPRTHHNLHLASVPR